MFFIMTYHIKIAVFANEEEPLSISGYGFEITGCLPLYELQNLRITDYWNDHRREIGDFETREQIRFWLRMIFGNGYENFH